MLAIDRKERFTLPPGFGGDQFAGYNKTFFVSQADRLPGAHRFVCRLQACHPDNRAHYKIYLWVGGNPNRAGGSVHHFDFR
jgi:hypothetical protein